MKQQTEHAGRIDNGVIGQLAYDLWERAGRPHGRDQEFWFKAEAQLREKVKPAPTTATAPAPAQKISTPPPPSKNTAVPPAPEIRRTIAVAPPPSPQRNQRLTSQTATLKSI